MVLSIHYSMVNTYVNAGVKKVGIGGVRVD